MGGQLTLKADVYSFGVLILEIISGRSSCKENWGGTQQLLVEYVCYLFISSTNRFFIVHTKLNKISKCEKLIEN